MAAFTSIALGALAAASIGSSIKGIVDADSAKEEMQRQNNEAKQKQTLLMQEQKKMKDQENYTNQAEIDRDAQIQRQKSLAASAQGRSGTILTSGLESSSQSASTGKTILGG